MIKSALFAAIGLVFVSTEAMATCSSYPYSLTNGTTANADQVVRAAQLKLAIMVNSATGQAYYSNNHYADPIPIVVEGTR